MSFYSRSSGPEVPIPSPSQCRFLRRCSTTGRFHIFVRAAGSHPALLLKLALWKLRGQRGDAGGCTFPLLRPLLPHECRINGKSSKASRVLESEATFHQPHLLTFLPSPHVWPARPRFRVHTDFKRWTQSSCCCSEGAVWWARLTDCRSFASFLMQRHVIILHFWRHLSLCFGVKLHQSTYAVLKNRETDRAFSTFNGTVYDKMTKFLMWKLWPTMEC